MKPTVRWSLLTVSTDSGDSLTLFNSCLITVAGSLLSSSLMITKYLASGSHVHLGCPQNVLLEFVPIYFNRANVYVKLDFGINFFFYFLMGIRFLRQNFSITA